MGDKPLLSPHERRGYTMFGGGSGAKEPSLPKNWPKPSDQDLAERPKRVVSIRRPQQYSFSSNFVKTSKYEVWNFVPKFLFEEFNPKTKVANCYFLLVSALQTIPEISNTFGYPTTLLPLIFVVLVDAIFAIIEDYARHRADKEANASKTRRFDEDLLQFVECRWADLEVGDIVEVLSREKIPADLIIFGVSEKTQPAQGICYVETKSLDGETNLKIRHALPNTLNEIRGREDVTRLEGYVEMEHPNKLIDSFNGIIDLGPYGREGILPANILLRGCVLRNTDWAIGAVCNTGHDTKIMMSSTETPSKTSNLESSASKEITRIILLLAVVCLTGSTGAAIWNSTHNVEDKWYLDWDPNPGTYWVIQFFYFFLLHATFIPVSLYVSMTLVRFFQSYFMNNDLEMYYAKTDMPALVRTMPLNEELGQISHIFSDKTGTLTCNIMDFRKASINGVSYGKGITEIGKASWKLQGKDVPDEILKFEEQAKANAVPHVSFYCPDYSRDMQQGGQQKQSIQLFYRILSLCHDVIPERVNGTIKLSASNPDDEALVCAAEYFGYKFLDRKGNFAVVLDKEADKQFEVELLQSIAFTSKRKRMSVIIRDVDGKIKLYCKGADTAMLPRISPGSEQLLEETDAHMRQYSSEGLRCLMICYREIEESEFKSWDTAYSAATSDLTQLENRKKGLKNTIEELEEDIERKLVLVGCTAIEDRLQDGVPECIAQLAQAGINIWVLTGDKEETAINIAVACNLVLPIEYMRQVIVNGKTAPNVQAMSELFESEMTLYADEIAEHGEDAVLPRCLVIDGPSVIEVMLDTGEDGLKAKMLEFSKLCKAVVGCRVSPDQKREMVNLIKKGVPGVRTLSVGDGANDVAMIQEAHVGVGIRGEEGVQAVNASDYAIAQFRYLSPLLLKHGRYNYIRMCHLVCYMFYKNIFMSISQFWFAWLNGFSGQKIYTEGGIQLFNLVFTSFPILLLGVYDMDVEPKAVYENPQLYEACIRNENFKPMVFWGWMIHAILESLVVAYTPALFLTNADPATGTYDTFWQSGALTFTAVIVVVNLKMAFIQTRWHIWHIVLLAFSIASWFVIAVFINSFALIDYEWYQIFNRLLGSGSFWLGLLLIVTVIIGKDLYLAGLQRNFDPKLPQIIQQRYINSEELKDNGESGWWRCCKTRRVESIEPVTNPMSTSEPNEHRRVSFQHVKRPTSEQRKLVDDDGDNADALSPDDKDL